MDADKAAENLTVIRQLMERPIRYSTMSGLSGILAGVAALGGGGRRRVGVRQPAQ